MKREIKFKFIVDKIYITRPYTIEELLFLNEEDILEQMEVCTCELNESNNHCECNPEFCDSEITGKIQYTELKDKNGKEIYEDDIVKVKNVFSQLEVRLVKWFNDGTIGWGTIENNQKYGLNSKDLIEIIGNIHQNKDLIK